MVYMQFGVVIIFSWKKKPKLKQDHLIPQNYPNCGIQSGPYEFLPKYATSSGELAMNLCQREATCTIDTFLMILDVQDVPIKRRRPSMLYGNANLFKRCGKLISGERDYMRQPIWTSWISCTGARNFSLLMNYNSFPWLVGSFGIIRIN